MNDQTATFKTGITYYTRSIADHDCIVLFTVLRRTAKSIWVTDWRNSKNTVRRALKSNRYGEKFSDSSWYVSAEDVLPAGGTAELRA
jgi:hypothetical protein